MVTHYDTNLGSGNGLQRLFLARYLNHNKMHIWPVDNSPACKFVSSWNMKFNIYIHVNWNCSRPIAINQIKTCGWHIKKNMPIFSQCCVCWGCQEFTQPLQLWWPYCWKVSGLLHPRNRMIGVLEADPGHVNKYHMRPVLMAPVWCLRVNMRRRQRWSGVSLAHLSGCSEWYLAAIKHDFGLCGQKNIGPHKCISICASAEYENNSDSIRILFEVQVWLVYR